MEITKELLSDIFKKASMIAEAKNQ